MTRVRIAGIGSHAPEKVLTNHDLAKMVDTNDEWITQRTGIKERRIAADGECSSDLGAVAARAALKDAGVTPEDVDLIYYATSTPDRIVPSTSAYLQEKIGAFNAGAVDMIAACSGFMYALNAGWHAVAMEQSKCCLILGSEVLTRLVNWKDRSTCIIFGDAAGAAVLTPSDDESDILYSRMGCDGRLADLIITPAGGSAMMPTPETIKEKKHCIQMKGREVFKLAVPKFVEIIREALDACSLTLDDLKLIVPHQMNARMIQAVADRLKIPVERIFTNIDRYGNTSAASIPVALDESHRAGLFKRGDLILLTAMGAGLTWGTSIIRF